MIASEYERIRKGRGGIAIAEVVQGRCSKCNMLLRPQFLQELKRGDSVMVCESCKRMLYYNPPQSMEDLGAADHAYGLHHLVDEGLLEPGERILLVGTGMGFTFSAAVLAADRV